ncbi:MAG: pyruvate kinase [Geminicoccaceae bacterium]|nr:pyruvate kinase [Geminicoccaceae bacterium]
MTSERASKTKIVATIGPASDDRPTLERMIEAGMNVARLNFAHGDFATHGATIGAIRAAAEAVGRRVAILADLPGPKLRIGQLAEQPIELARGQRFTLAVGTFTGDATRAATTFARLPEVVKPGDLIFLNDGLVQLRVERIEGQDVHGEIVAGGPLLSNKGINLPDVDLGIGAFTERDRECLEIALSQRVDAIGQSFVQGADDVLAVRSAAEATGGTPLIFAKIERAVALERIDEILAVADGIMVARGDLGVEIPIERVAIAQKDLIGKANLIRKPAITATQMLLSMVESRRPTRAEATDVANAILAHPVEAVRMLCRIARVTEPRVVPRFGPAWREPTPETASDAELVVASVAHIAERTRPLGILVPSATGGTARRMAAYRQPVWITAVSRSARTCQELQFVYGVDPIHAIEAPDSWAEFARRRFQDRGPGRVLLTQGTIGPAGGANRFEILTL